MGHRSLGLVEVVVRAKTPEWGRSMGHTRTEEAVITGF